MSLKKTRRGGIIICLDFDGTLVTHEFPHIGKDIGAVPVLKKLLANGHRLILNTMRSDVTIPKSTDPFIQNISGNHLTNAINWCKENDIQLYAANINPEQSSWTSSPKIYGHLYIDDAAIGTPLIYDKTISDRPFVDWKKVEILLQELNLID